MDELKELRKAVKELRKAKTPVTSATVEDLKREIAIHSAGMKALEIQTKRMEALAKARSARVEKKEEKPKKVAVMEPVVEKVEKPKKEKVEKPKKEKVEKVKVEKEPELAKNIRRRVVKDGSDE